MSFGLLPRTPEARRAYLQGYASALGFAIGLVADAQVRELLSEIRKGALLSLENEEQKGPAPR